ATELRRAAQTCAQARQLLSRLFSDARLGRPVDASAAGQLVDDVTASVARNPHALIGLARLKTADDYTYMHSLAVCALMVALAKRMGLDDHSLRKAGMAGLMHDLGKTAIPVTVLNKPGPLDDAEWALMRAHPRHGEQLLRPLGLDDEVIDACLHHHEKVDGSGYPDGLQQGDIGLLARMTAICDVYDAITSDRPYKKGWPPSEALRRMAEWSPRHFDKRLFEQFVQTVGIYPLGSLVRLHSQRLAVVVDASPASLLAPRVKVFYSLRQSCRITPEIEDLSESQGNDRIIAREDPADWDFPDLESLWLEFERQPQAAMAR
ncbi:MAG: phosphodiesterase, partial [Delftia acidovorans]